MSDHGPNCVACSDPAGLPALLTERRAELDTEAERARAHRAAGEAAREETYTHLLAHDWQLYGDAQARMLHHLGTANAIATGVMCARAHLQRVEEAHPRPTVTVPVQGALL